MIGIRLQGGPFDGEKAKVNRLARSNDLPEHLYIKRCDYCQDTDWFEVPTEGTEVYRLDEEHRRWVLYVWVDEELDRHLAVTETLVGSSA
jgi:hypothetical protein